MPELRALIADDEELGRIAVRLLLDRDPRFVIAAEVADGASAIERIEAGGIDVAFLDIHMPGLDGLEVAARLGEQRPLLVFVTAHEEHAVRAFGEAATDYLVKPLDAARFAQALDRVHQRARERQAGAAAAPAEAPRIALPLGNRRVLVSPAELVSVEAAGNYVLVRQAGTTEPHRLRRTMKALLDEWDLAPLMRVHRAFAVNLAHVRELRTTDGAHGLECRMSEGPLIPVGRTYRNALRERFENDAND